VHVATFVVYLAILVSALPMNIDETLANFKIKCEKAARTANAGGNYVRQCMKDSRAAARAEHAKGLRGVLDRELGLFRARKAKIASDNGLPAREQNQPHILLITTDQQRRDTIGVYARRDDPDSPISTPHLDRLAAEGCLVLDAFSAAPVCAPSRTSILLGVHVPVHGVAENGLGGYNPKVTAPFVDVLAGASASPPSPLSTSERGGLGYTAALVGKAGFSPLPSGFTHANVLGEGANEARSPTTSRHDFLEAYLVNCSMLWILERNRLEPARPWFLHLSLASPHPPNTLPLGWPLRYDFDGAANCSLGGGHAPPSSCLPGLDFVEGDLEALPVQTKALQSMVEVPSRPAVPFTEAGGGQPAGQQGTGCVGNSSVSGSSRRDNTGGVLSSSPSPPRAELRAEWVESSRAFPTHLNQEPDRASIAAARANYYNQAAFVDDQVGRLTAFLDGDMEFGERLLLIFTSDHGALLHDHGVPDKHTLLGEAPRVPLLLRWPGWIAPGSTLAMASLVDLAPTIVSAALQTLQTRGQTTTTTTTTRGEAAALDYLRRRVSGFDLVAQITEEKVTRTVAISQAVRLPTREKQRSTSTTARSAVPVADFLGCGVFTKTWKLLYYPAANVDRAIWSGVGGQAFLFNRLTDPGDRDNRFTVASENFSPNTSHAAAATNRLATPADAAAAAAAAALLADPSDAAVSKAMLKALLRWRSRQRRPQVREKKYAAPSAKTQEKHKPSRGSSLVTPSSPQPASTCENQRFERARRLLFLAAGNKADADLSTDLEGF